MNDNELTKKEKYLFKKEKKEQEYFGKMRQKKTKKIIVISLLILIVSLVVFGFIGYLSKEKQESNQGIPELEIFSKEYDAGTVSMAEGLVEHTYEIKNNGEGDLKIDRIWTSCTCTTAILRVGDKVSPKFGMHTSSAFWSQKIAPGEIGYLDVSFDPAFHGPEATGYITRAIYLSTNDPQNKKAEARLIINVVQ